MAEIGDVVRINITRETTSVSQAGFGTLGVMAPTVAFLARTQGFNSPAAGAALYPVGDPIRIALDSSFASTPRIETVKVLRQQVDNVVVSVDVVANNTTYEIELDAVDDTGAPVGPVTIQFVSDADATAEEIAAGLVAAINLDGTLSPELTATDNLDGTYDIDTDSPGDAILVKPDASQSLVLAHATGRGTLNSLTPIAGESGALVGNALDAVRNSDPDWYGLVVMDVDDDTIDGASTWIETRRRIYGTTSSEAEIIDTTLAADTGTIAKQLQSESLSRSWMIWSGTPEAFPDAAWFGERLPSDPGSGTWRDKTLAGQQTDNLSDTQIANAKEKNVNIYITRGGVGITENGTMFEPEFIDVIRFVDWLQARMEERIFALKVTQSKIPFTDAGLATIEAEVRAQLQDGIDIGGLAADPPPTVTVPRVSTIPQQDKANRELKSPNTITFTATLAGAIHEIEINGTVTV